jgi:ABC-type spermidine/putrescine transport system permease subunit II
MTTAPRPPGLQPERTELAWRRTGLAVATASAIGSRALEPVLGTAAVALGTLGLVLAVVILAGAGRRARRHSITGSPGGGLLAAVVVASVAVGIAALVVVVAVQVRSGALVPS